MSGHGINFKSRVDVDGDPRAARLVRVLPDWQSEPAPVYALFASYRIDPPLPIHKKI